MAPDAGQRVGLRSTPLGTQPRRRTSTWGPNRVAFARKPNTNVTNGPGTPEFAWNTGTGLRNFPPRAMKNFQPGCAESTATDPA